jgi:hypothetical protein
MAVAIGVNVRRPCHGVDGVFVVFFYSTTELETFWYSRHLNVATAQEKWKGNGGTELMFRVLGKSVKI